MAVLPLLLLATHRAAPERDAPLQGARMSNIDVMRNAPAVRNRSAARSAFAARSASGLIGLVYEWLDEGAPGAVGQPLRVRVSVSSAQMVDSLGAEVYAHEGLVVSPVSWAMAGLQARESREKVLTVTPYVAGPLRFSILVHGRIDGQSQAAQITVPLPGYGLELP